MPGGGTDADPRVAARLGKVLKGKWRLDSVLGVGGLAAVYAATHRAGKRVAVKILHPEISANEEIRKRFLREAHAANRVGHPGVVTVSDDDVSEDGEAFLVMDLLEGETLSGLCKRFGGSLPPLDVLSYADQVLDVLAAAHDKGILHRDIKPANLFVTREGRIMVLDFGIARLHDLSGGGEPATQTGAMLGTPGFMSPEQASGLWARVDARSDLWALGATMFRLLSGQPVHRGLTPNQTVAAAITTPAPPLRSMAPAVPERVAAVVDRSLAFDPGSRWPDARAMQAAMREAGAALGEDAPTVQGPPPAPRPRLLEVPIEAPRRAPRRWALLVALVAGGALAVGAVYAVMKARSAGAVEATIAAASGTVAASGPAAESTAPTSVPTPPAGLQTPPTSTTAAQLSVRAPANQVPRNPKEGVPATPATATEDPFARRKR